MATTGPGDFSQASRQLLEQSFNERNFELVDRLVATGAINRDPAIRVSCAAYPDPDVLKRMATMYRAAFPDLRLTVDDVIAADDPVVLRWHAGNAPWRAPGLGSTGAHGSVTGMSSDGGRTAS